FPEVKFGLVGIESALRNIGRISGIERRDRLGVADTAMTMHDGLENRFSIDRIFERQSQIEIVVRGSVAAHGEYIVSASIDLEDLYLRILLQRFNGLWFDLVYEMS